MNISKYGLNFLFSSVLSGFCLISHASLASDPLVLPGRLAASLSNTCEQKIVQPTTKDEEYNQSLGVASAEGFCYLSGLSTSENDKGVYGEVYINTDNKWWLHAIVGKNNFVSAACIKWV